MRKIQLTVLKRTCQKSSRFWEVQSRIESQREECVKDETYEERPAGASLLCLKEICTQETITYKYIGRDLQSSQQSIFK